MLGQLYAIPTSLEQPFSTTNTFMFPMFLLLSFTATCQTNLYKFLSFSGIIFLFSKTDLHTLVNELVWINMSCQTRNSTTVLCFYLTIPVPLDNLLLSSPFLLKILVPLEHVLLSHFLLRLKKHACNNEIAFQKQPEKSDFLSSPKRQHMVADSPVCLSNRINRFLGGYK